MSQTSRQMLRIEILTISVLMAISISLALPTSYNNHHQPDDYAEERDYRFNYLIDDGYTYNHQTREEKKYGKAVTGQYTVLEPTGQLRVVDYVADDYGFRAKVHHRPHYNDKAGY